MSRDEKYNGWTNRETWAAFTWLTNDETMYHDVRGSCAEAIQDYVEGLAEQDERSSVGNELMVMFEDIGSLWRVNWEEIAKALSED